MSVERQAEKDRLLAEGFSKWRRLHYTAFIRASAKCGREKVSKITAEKEVEAIEKWAREQAGLPTAKEEGGPDLPLIELPPFKAMRREQRRKAAQDETEKQRMDLEGKVEEIGEKMTEIQHRLKVLNEFTRISSSIGSGSAGFPHDLLPDLANMVAKVGTVGIMTITNNFLEEHPGAASKTKICSKIEEIAVKEKRDNDTKATW